MKRNSLKVDVEFKVSFLRNYAKLPPEKRNKDLTNFREDHRHFYSAQLRNENDKLEV